MSMARFEAMVNSARQPGGSSLKACEEIEKRIGELHSAMEPFRREIRDLERLRMKAVTPKCSLLKPLVPPQEGLEPVAVFDGDGCYFYWHDENDEEVMQFEEWPVDAEYLYAADLEELGFRVEIA